MTRALATGLAVLVAGDVAFAFLGRLASPDAAAWGAWVAVGAAGFVVSWRAPRFKFAMGLLVAPLNAAIASVLTAIESARGGVSDFPGVRGAIAAFQLYLLTSMIPAAVASLAAYLFTRFGRAPRAPGPGASSAS